MVNCVPDMPFAHLEWSVAGVVDVQCWWEGWSGDRWMEASLPEAAAFDDVCQAKPRDCASTRRRSYANRTSTAVLLRMLSLPPPGRTPPTASNHPSPSYLPNMTKTQAFRAKKGTATTIKKRAHSPDSSDGERADKKAKGATSSTKPPAMAKDDEGNPYWEVSSLFYYPFSSSSMQTVADVPFNNR